MTSVTKPWFMKYQTDTKAIVSRETQLAKLRSFITNYKTSKVKALLLYGPCGSGKTTAVSALAKEFNYELFEINASDTRNKDQLESVLLPAVKQKSFFYNGKIILVDEVDGIAGNEDRGAVTTLLQIMEQSSVPIILTANTTDNDKLKPLLKKVDMILFDKLTVKDIMQICQQILDKEKITLDSALLRTLAVLSDGDARAAINDLELLSQNGSIDILTERKRTKSIQALLQVVFKTKDAKLISQTQEETEEDIDELFLWIDYNMPVEYSNSPDLARAYGAISRADIFRRRIRKNQEWRFLVYILYLLTVGVALSKDDVYAKPFNIKQTSRLLKIWQMNMSNARKISIAQKIAAKTHTSTKRVLRDMAQYSHIAQKFALQQAFDLSDEEILWLKNHSKPQAVE